MSISGIQGQLLEVTVVGCNKLKDTEWISRQDPYVCLEYGSTKYRTRTCTDGGKNPTFQEKFVFNLIEGLREFSVVVWNSNTVTFDDFIGSGKIQLHKVVSQGYDDCPWTIQDKRGKYSGEVRLIMHYANANANKPGKTHAPSAPQYAGTPAPQIGYSGPPSAAHYPPNNYPMPPLQQPIYPSYGSNAGYPYHQPAAYPSLYPPPPSAYPSQSAYPPPSTYPPQSAYPSQSAYPPPPQVDPYHPYTYPHGSYPPPPY